MIAVLSPDYVKSDYCRKELARADRMKRPIVPVLLRPVPDTEWPLEIEREQYVDFRSWQDRSVYSAKFDELMNALRQRANAQIGDIPELETQYLISLIAELEARRGVLEYVDLSAQTDDLQHPDPHSDKGWDQEFALLVQSGVSTRPGEMPKLSLTSIYEATAKYQRFVIKGAPGSGKTTTLRRLVVEAARERLDNPRTAPFPILLYLPNWDEGLDPLGFVLAHWPFKSGELQGMLARGEISLYLDGLNEMGSLGKAHGQQLRQWFKTPDGPERVIVTCRTADYSGELDLDLPTVLAEPLDAARIRRFVNLYLGEERAKPFLDLILPTETWPHENRRHLFQLARNPYLLAALIYIYNNTPNGELPRNSGSLFKGMVRALWEREHIRQGAGWQPFEKIETDLARLAYAMIDEDKAVDVSLEYVQTYIQDRALLNLAQNANFLEVRDNKVRFYHQLLQEYFAAVQLAVHDLNNLISNPQLWVFGRQAQKWDQVIIAYCGITSNPETPFTLIVSKDPWLAADCIASGIRISTITRQNTINLLLLALRNNDFQVRGASAKSLCVIADAAAVPGLIQALKDTYKVVRANAITALENIGDKTTVPELTSVMLHDDDWQVRWLAVQALSMFQETSAIPSMIDGLSDSNSDIRAAIIKMLGNMKATTAIGALRDRLLDKESTIAEGGKLVRELAADALRLINTPEALEALEWGNTRSASPDTLATAHIFVAYTRSDTKFMQNTVNYLHDQGLRLWTDELLEPGTRSWEQAIFNAIETAACILIFLSPNAYQSPWVLAEMDYALARNIPAVPVLIYGEEPVSIPLRLGRLQFFDLRAKANTVLPELADHLKN